MSFASPSWLLLLGLAILVVALHLTRRRERPVSSIMFWRHLAGRSSTQRTVRKPPLTLPLLLQLLALSLLVLALAQPIFRSGATEGPIEHLIVVLDASASMQAEDSAISRFEAARAEARAQLSSLAPTARTSIVVAGPDPDAIAARQAPARAKTLLEGLKPLDAPADWPGTARLIAGLTRAEERTLAVILTDGPSEPEAVAELQVALQSEPVAPTIETETFGKGSSNLGFAAVGLEPVDLEDGDWLLTGEILRTGDEPSEVTLEIWFEPHLGEGSLLWSEQTARLSGSHSTFEVNLELPGPGAFEIRLPSDALASDDRAYLIVENRPRAARVLHVGPPNPDLQRALQALDGVELFESDELPESSGEFDLVVVDRIDVSRHPGTHTLWIASPPAAFERNGPVELLSDPSPTGWRDEGDLSTTVDWSAIEVSTARRMTTLPGSAVLLESSEWPLVQTVTRTTGFDTVLSFALEDSNWPELPSFPMFIASLVRAAVPGLGQPVAPWCLTGRGCSLPFHPNAQLLGPDGRAVAVPYLHRPPSTGSSNPRASDPRAMVFEPTFLPQDAGFYRLVYGDSEEWIAVNAFHSEESLSVAPAADGEGTNYIEGRSKVDPIDYFSGWAIWRLLVLLALLVILADVLAAGLGREKFLWPTALITRNPLSARYRWIVGMQAASAVLLLLTLLDVRLPLPSRATPTAFVVESNDFLVDGTAGRGEALRLLTSRSNDVGLVHIGQRSELLRSWNESDVPSPSSSRATPGGDLEGALDLAAGMLAGTQGTRIVLASSGVETVGDLQNSLSRLIRSGIPIHVLPLPGLPPGEVVVEKVSVPARVRPSESFQIQGLVFSEKEQGATVTVYRDGQELLRRDVLLQPGRNRVEAQTAEEAPGNYLFEITVTAESDVLSENNREGTYVEISSPPSVLVVSPQAEWGKLFANALSIQGVEAQVVEPRSAPWRLEGLLEHEVVVLLNVPAIDLHSKQQEQLARWVSVHGGGLLILGGENAFGPGGYYRTTLEDISPLSSRVPRDAPLVAMLFVLDRSGSMQQAVSGITRLRIAKEATAEAIELLDQQSRVGVVVFDSEASVLLPMQPVGDQRAFARALEGLGASGGTAIHPALMLAFEEMAPVDAATRHVVLMTDGLSQPGDFAGIMQRFTEEEITVSTVAIGQGADVTLLKSVARAAGGTFHQTTDFQALPGILSQEAMLLSSTPLEQDTFTPTRTGSGVTFLKGLPEQLPPLRGYVRTTSKPEATVHLQAAEDDPLLASWRFGLGRVLAFASHGAGSWSREWLGTPAYPLLWSQAVSWAQPLLSGPGLNLRTQRRGDVVQVLVEAVSAEGNPFPRLNLQAFVRPLDEVAGAMRSFRLEESQPGQYRGEVLLLDSGNYELTVAPADPSQHPVLEPAKSFVHVAYPARYSLGRQDMDRLLALSEVTGGRLLLSEEDVRADQPEWMFQRAPVWRVLLATALLLFLLSLLYRYAPTAALSYLRNFGRHRKALG